jgi:hypothetical protein
MRRTVITWSAAFALLFAGFGASVAVLNSDLYSAHGFVRGYLSALENRDSAAALEIPGVQTSNDAATALLSDDAMGDISDVEIVSDSEETDGTHTVVVSYTLGTPSASGLDETTDATSSFVVARSGTRLALFPTWRFVTSPLNTISITVLHDQRFEVNGLDLSSQAKPDAAATYLAFAPGVYVVAHESVYLESAPVATPVTEIGQITDVTVDVQANSAFVTEVQKNVTEYLEACATQEVLMPTGCPFGQQLRNRVTTAPAWSMIADPVVTIVPGAESGTWAVPKTEATAHLVVDVRSLFDGTVSTFDDDVPFTVQYLVTFEGNKTVITAVYE